MGGDVAQRGMMNGGCSGGCGCGGCCGGCGCGGCGGCGCASGCGGCCDHGCGGYGAQPSADSAGGPTGSGGTSRPGDWICESCGNINFMKRTDCKKCGAQRLKGQKRLGMRPGDWICPNCDDLVFSNKNS